ncbi:solute carrier family 2, facilitated glucose transporter member 1-like [Physella acuta]|uniref:solute carrier family 2, facilitated glucose transporter member 1-like n=1 Tax=Physella acuta TaxID=109671 RepID=UPI0027DB27BE|nr:solute carrier family 2, facilitated glucose transporter member 1-like [Physella acuta]
MDQQLTDEAKASHNGNPCSDAKFTFEVKRKSTRQNVTCFLVLTILGAAMGSLQFGYNVGVINAPESLIKEFMNVTQHRRHGSGMTDETARNLWALTVSIFSAGGCLGGFLAGWWATKLGRKLGSLANVIIGVVGSALMFASRRVGSYEMITVGRVVIGFHAGLYTGISPMYLSEISPANIRGGIGVLHQLAIVSGILISQILGFPDLLGTPENWDVLLGLSVGPCLLQALILPFCPESPRYLLITKQDEKKCRDALVKLRGSEDIEDEMDEIKQEMMSCKTGSHVSILQLFRSPSLRAPMLIGVVMQLSQQLSGINGVFFYSTSLFEDAGLSKPTAKYITSAVGGIMVAMTIITIPLMDRVGRRTLHLTGLGGMAVFSLVITIALALRGSVSWFDVASIVLMLLYVVFFALGPGSIPWLIVSELFSHDARPTAMSVCVLVNWVSSFLVGFVFPSLQAGLKDYTFLPFTVLLVLFFIFTFYKVPETKGKTFDEVTALWRNDSCDSRHETNAKPLSRNKIHDVKGTKVKGEPEIKSIKYGSTNEAFSADIGDGKNQIN